jgi:DNA replication protein DnaC
VPAVFINGKPVAGTGVWRSQLIDRRCPACHQAAEQQQVEEHLARERRKNLVQLLGGEKPLREFTFARYRITPGNRLGYERCNGFNPTTENLYLWGACGVGKTHMACAAARRSSERALRVIIQPSGQLSRKTRMKDPSDEQSIIDELVNADVLVVDDLGAGATTAYWCQLIQEILDRRSAADRAGLLVTSKYSLGALADKLQDDSISSRLAGLCSLIQIRGPDARLVGQPSFYNSRSA